jgi:CheY-like chemotaxis protein
LPPSFHAFLVGFRGWSYRGDDGSERGHGTSIKIYLPKSCDTVHAPDKDPMQNVYDTTKKLQRILVVEDNSEVLKLTSAMVANLGYDVLEASDGDSAIEIIKERGDIDMLLTDVMLPGKLNGPGLAKQALLIRPNLKILFNSGYAEQAIFQTGVLEVGAQIISKPFRKQQLANKIFEILK